MSHVMSAHRQGLVEVLASGASRVAQSDDLHDANCLIVTSFSIVLCSSVMFSHRLPGCASVVLRSGCFVWAAAASFKSESMCRVNAYVCNTKRAFSWCNRQGTFHGRAVVWEGEHRPNPFLASASVVVLPFCPLRCVVEEYTCFAFLS